MRLIQDEGLRRFDTNDRRALGIEVDGTEANRFVKAARMGVPFIPRITRRTVLRFICLHCGSDYMVTADTAIIGRPRCPSLSCVWRAV